MASISSEQVKWMEESVNLQLRNFTVLVARHYSLANEDIVDHLTPIVFEVGKRQRKPATEKRCIARLLKGGGWEQCSHKYSCGCLCKTHAKMGTLKYGTIHEPIPNEYRGKYKENTESTTETESRTDPSNDFYSALSHTHPDLSLYPQSKQQLTEIKIAGRPYLQDRVTACLYTSDRNRPVFIGRGIEHCIVREGLESDLS